MENSKTPTIARAVFAGLVNAFLLASTLLWPLQAVQAQTAALIPNAKQQYLNANGQPLSGGSVFSYVPNTTSPKTTWSDPNQVNPNSEPVVLDASGGAFIFGQGNYRQIVKDVNGNTIWDGFTSAYGSAAPSGSTGTDTAPVGTILPWAGFNFNVPTNWQLAYGQAVSRTTFAQLEAAITISTTTGNCVSSSTTISGFADTSQLRVGAPIEGSCLPTGDTVATIVNGTTITVSVAATATGTFTVTAFPWGNGDGTTTFNLPDLRGRVLPGADAMGGTAASRLTSTFYGASASPPGVAGGSQSQTASTSIAAGNVPTITSNAANTVSVSASGFNIAAANTAVGNALGPGSGGGNYAFTASGSFVTITSINSSGSNNISVSSNNTGGGSPPAASSASFATIQPSMTMDYIIKVAPNTTGAGGVTSFGGMFGDIVCASSLTCAPVGSPAVNTVGCTAASNSQLGCVQTDGVTTIISAGKLVAIAGIASTINVGGTSVGSGSNGFVLYDNAGTLGNLPVTGTAGNVVLSNSPTLVTPALGTPSAIVLTNATGLPLNTAVTGTLQPANGGLGTNASAATGVVQFSSGVASITSALANGTTGTTQTVGDTTTKLATDQFVSQVASLPSLAISGAQITSGTVATARLPLGSNSSVGIVQCDGTTISCNGSGVITAVGAAATSITALVTTTASVTSGDVLGSTSSGCSGTTPCLADTQIAAASGTMTFTKNSVTTLTLQDASSSQDKLVVGTASSTTCDPGIIFPGLPGSGPCYELNGTPNTAGGAWNTLLLQATNSRVVIASNDGVQNPEIICSGVSGAFGVPVWNGGNQSGCGYLSAARINSGNPVTWNFVAGGYPQTNVTASNANGISGNGLLTVTAQSGKPIVFGETFVGAGFTKFTITGSSTVGSGNCSPACTGAGGTGTYASSITTSIGSETMIGGPSGAENSASIQVYGGSLAGDTQNILMFFNGTGCATWGNSPCNATAAGARLGEVAGTGMSGDGLFTQTETGSWNIYAALNYSGTHLDGSYTAPTNMVLRLGPNATAPERITAVFDYNANLLLGTSWTITSAVTGISGGLFVGPNAPTNVGLLNSVYQTASQQGMTIQNSGGDTGSGHAVLFSRTDGTTEGSIVISASGTAFNTTSDGRLKTNVRAADEREVGSVLDRLEVVSYNFKDDLARRFVGFIAQDEYKVFPDAVTPGDSFATDASEEGFRAWGRDDSKLVPLLVREVQELRKRVRQLERRR